MTASNGRRAVAWIVAIIVVTTLAVGAAFVGYRQNWFEVRLYTAENEPIGANVHATGEKVSRNLQASAIDASPPVPEAQSLGPVVHIEPGGPLTAPLTLHFTLGSKMNAESLVFIASRDTSTSEWTYQQAKISADGQRASITRTHLSFFWPFTFNMAELLKSTGSEVVNAVLGKTPKATQPKCENGDNFNQDGHSVTVQGGPEALLYCTGVETIAGESRRVLRVTNNRNYPLLISYTEMERQKPTPDELKVELQRIAQIVTKLASKKQTVLFPSETATFAVNELAPGGNAKVVSEYGGLAQSLHRMDIALAGLTFMFTKMGGKGLTLDALSRWKNLDMVLEGLDCANAVYSLSAGEVIAKCFTAVKLGKLYDWRAAFLAPLTTLGTFGNWLHSELTSLFDQFNGRSRQTVTVARENTAAAFYGTWIAHGSKLVINENGGGYKTQHRGACNNTSTCSATMDIRWRIEGETLIFTITSFSSKDETGQPEFDTGTDGEIVGESFNATLVTPGQVAITANNERWQVGEVRMCNTVRATNSDRANCGA